MINRDDAGSEKILCGYFLTMWEIVRFCCEQGILCQGRGSAANSAVCYSLGRDPGDELILERAERDRRVLVTIDTDFGTLIYRDQAHHCGLIRPLDVPPKKRIQLMG